jgi:hypothetical protein
MQRIAAPDALLESPLQDYRLVVRRERGVCQTAWTCLEELDAE